MKSPGGLPNILRDCCVPEVVCIDSYYLKLLCTSHSALRADLNDHTPSILNGEKRQFMQNSTLEHTDQVYHVEIARSDRTKSVIAA